MTLPHELRGHLHAARLHLTFITRALASSGGDHEVLDSAAAATTELRQIERLVLELLTPAASPR